MTIYSYIDSLLDMWCSWNDIFLTQQLHSNISNLNEILNSSGSDKPSRAKEMYRIGLLKKELSKGDDAWNALRKGENLQTRLGFISAVIRQAMIIDPENSSLRQGFSSLCAIYSVIQSERINNTELSIATIAIDLLNRFPNNSEYSDLTWLRYILSAFYCELEESAEDLEKMFLSSTVISLRILEKDKGVLKCRATVTNSEDVKSAIRSNVSLTNIIKQKSALFAIGEVSVNNCRGFLGQAFLSCKALLYAMHDLEISTPGLLQPIHIESNASQKPHVFDFLNNLAAQHQSFNQEYIKIMNNIAQGAREALEVLFPKDTNGNNALGEALQVIYYGAPGTGKSHIVKKQTEGESVVRTTFHPDSDYSTFVGCYKPTTKPCPIYTSYGEKAVTIKDATGKELTENRIVYEFVDQAFLQAYVKAWKFYAQATEGSDPKKQYLIIEEINRGNCAQIFGDLFQLLDRNGRGFSDYYIHADKDMQKHLSEALNNLVIEESHKEKINSMYHGDVVEKVLSGEILLLPNNFYIWATMNTSDQSLFPIDSAFKRRWNWKYRPIVKGRDEEGNELNWKIVANKKYDWWSFLEKINAVVASTTNSEDKKLGFFFCKAVDGVISAETFVDKVIFYLWNDVFKNFGFEDSIFNDEEDKSKLEFDKFYTTNPNGETIIREYKVEKFLDNLKVKVVGETIVEEEDEDGNTISSSKRDYTKYSVNGVGRYAKNRLAEECVKAYIELNPEMSAEEVLQNWKSLGNIVSHFIESSDEYNARTDNNKDRSSEIECGGTKLYVAHDGYGNNGAVERLIDAVKNKNWDLKIEIVE